MKLPKKLDKVIANIKANGVTSEELQHLIEHMSKEEAHEFMRRLGCLEAPAASIAEMYHDAVQRGDPDEIAWLRAQWLKEQGRTKQ